MTDQEIPADVEGKAEGIFYREIKDGQLHVEPYDYHDRNARPVSYTHLYFLNLGLEGDVLSAAKMAVVGVLVPTYFGTDSWVMPVSYTHLDVYKRQPMCLLTPRSSPLIFPRGYTLPPAPLNTLPCKR